MFREGFAGPCRERACTAGGSCAMAWRKGWDSNPRYPCRHGGFQDRCLKPLGHPSAERHGLSKAGQGGEGLFANGVPAACRSGSPNRLALGTSPPRSADAATRGCHLPNVMERFGEARVVRLIFMRRQHDTPDRTPARSPGSTDCATIDVAGKPRRTGAACTGRPYQHRCMHLDGSLETSRVITRDGAGNSGVIANY